MAGGGGGNAAGGQGASGTQTIGQFGVGSVGAGGGVPLVTGVTPAVGVGAVGLEPQITIVPEGSMMSAAAVVSADLRYVRLAVVPNFSTISEVFTFTFLGNNAGQMNRVP
jgi:hypothetical protein